MEDLNEFASKELGSDVAFEESILFTPDEIGDICSRRPKENMLVHSMGREDFSTVMLLTTNYPMYEPWALIVEDDKGERTEKYFSEE